MGKGQLGIQSTTSSKLPTKANQFSLLGLSSFAVLGVSSPSLSFSLSRLLTLPFLFHFFCNVLSCSCSLCFFTGNENDGSKSSSLFQVISSKMIRNKSK